MAESYFVKSHDGTEYGPATYDELITWHKEGRIATDTKIRISSTHTVVEAGKILGPSVVAVPPVSPIRPTTVQGPVAATKSSIPSWAWVVAVCLLCVLCVGVPTIVTALFLSSVPTQTRVYETPESDESRIAGSLVGLGKLPDLTKMDQVVGRLKGVLPDDLATKATGFRFNSALSELDLGTLSNPGEVWLFQGSENLGAGQRNVCFADGECRAMNEDQFKRVQQVAPVPDDPGPGPQPDKPKAATL